MTVSASNSKSNPFRTFKQQVHAPFDPLKNDTATRAEEIARADCDGFYDADFNDTVVNVYYWVTRPGGKLVAPEIEIETYDAATGEPYEFDDPDDEALAVRLAIEHWVEDGDGLADYYNDEI